MLPLEAYSIGTWIWRCGPSPWSSCWPCYPTRSCLTVQARRPSVDSRRHRKNLAHSDKTKHKKQIKTKETTGKQNKNLIDSFVVLRCNCAPPLARSILGPGPHCTQCVVARCYEAARAADSFNLACCHWKHHKETGKFDDNFFLSTNL